MNINKNYKEDEQMLLNKILLFLYSTYNTQIWKSNWPNYRYYVNI